MSLLLLFLVVLDRFLYNRWYVFQQVALAERKESQKSMFELIKNEKLKDSPSHAKMVEEYLGLCSLKSSPEKGTIF